MQLHAAATSAASCSIQPAQCTYQYAADAEANVAGTSRTDEIAGRRTRKRRQCDYVGESASTGHEPSGEQQQQLQQSSADDRAEWSAGAATANPADTGTQHVPDGQRERECTSRTSATLSRTVFVGRPGSAATLLQRLHTEPTEPYSVAAGLPQEPFIGHLLRSDVRWISESYYRIHHLSKCHANVDGEANAVAGVGRATGENAAANHHAVRQEYAGAKTGAADRHRTHVASANLDDEQHTATSTLLRDVYPAEATAATAARLPASKQCRRGVRQYRGTNDRTT